MNFAMPALIPYAAAFALVMVLVPASTVAARRLGAVTTPREDRWNRRAVPTLGGIALFGGITAAVVVLPLPNSDRIPLLAGLAIMFMLGLADDLAHISVGRRLLVEAAVGATFVWAVSAGLTTELRVAAVILGAVAVPVAVNATNLTDNADGLATTLAIATAGTLAAASSLAGLVTATSTIAIAIAAAGAGFLVYNRPPARVFMGDCGSLMLGFALAATSILIVRDALLIPGSAHVAAAMAVPVAWAFQVGDLVMVVASRIRRGSSPFAGGVDHTSHRLMAAGVTPVFLIVGLGLLAAAVGSVAAIGAAVLGGFELMAVVAIALLLLVGAFEAAVAWRLPPHPTKSVGAPNVDPASPPSLAVKQPGARL